LQTSPLIMPSNNSLPHFIVSRLRKISFALLAVILLLGMAVGGIWQHLANGQDGHAGLLGNRTPGEILRYTLHRLEGHPNLERLLTPELRWIQRRYERPVPDMPLPSLGKGQQAAALPSQRYDLSGHPLATQLAPQVTASATGAVVVNSADSLVSAVHHAAAGQIIEIAPGSYRIHHAIGTDSAGTQLNPITVRAAQPGQVILEVDSEVAFRVSQPYWVFENMTVRGVCQEHRYCEHAFHVFGAAQQTVIRNNRLEDFNAHIKINGAGNAWPDNGLIQYNTLTNSTRRETALPVTPIDLVGANQWHVVDNLISNFVKGDGNLVSYGVFMKGASSGGRIERNLIICTPKDISQPGVRVGISFGGGGTGKPYCRDQACTAEHTAGLAANNIVAHCNDFGVDVHDANGILIAHNTLINTAGIDVRGAQAHARLYANLLDGRLRQRDGGQIRSQFNSITELSAVFDAADQLLLTWRVPPENIPSLGLVPADFLGQTRQDGTAPGALAGTTLSDKI